jgi:hypothetical protein
MEDDVSGIALDERLTAGDDGIGGGGIRFRAEGTGGFFGDFCLATVKCASLPISIRL